MSAQNIATAPSRIDVSNPPVVAAGQKGQIDIKLVNAAGQPVPADRDITFRVAAANADVASERVVIPKGQSAAQLSVTKAQPGLSDIRIEQTNAPNPSLAATTQIAFSPAGGYTPRLPLGVLLSVSPGPKLKAGIESGKLVARIVDRNKVPTSTDHDIQISFPELSERISPHPLNIPTGQPYGEAVISSKAPAVLVLKPIVVPPTSVTNDAPRIEFISPVVGLRILTDPSYVNSLRRPTIRIKIGLVDAQGNWIATDKDRTVILHTEPTAAGRLQQSELTIPNGASVAQTTFIPYQEGIAEIKAVAGSDLVVEAGRIEFHYTWMFFLGIAALGGVVGGVIRESLQQNRSLRKVALGALAGLALGSLAYVLAPLLVNLSLKPEGLQNASKLFEAFVWGFFGGGSGALLFARVFKPA